MQDPLAFQRQIRQQLTAAHWQPLDIVAEPILHAQQRTYHPDFALLYNLYPLAILETASAVDDSRLALTTQYASSANVSFALVADTARIVLSNAIDGSVRELTSFPSPEDLWLMLGRPWSQDDPRLFPPAPFKRGQPQFFHAQAISQLVEAVMAGNTHIRVAMAVGSGNSYVTLQCAWKLIRSRYKRQMLFVVQARLLLDQLQELFEPFGEDASVLDGSGGSNMHGHIQFVTAQRLLSDGNGGLLQALPKDLYDVIIYDSTPTSQELARIASHFEQAQHIVISSTTGPETAIEFGQPIFQYTVQDIIEADYARPPEGYTAVRLAEVAEIRSGPRVRVADRVDGNHGTTQFVVMGKDLQPDGTVNVTNLAAADPQEIEPQYELRPDDILLLSVSSRATYKVALVPQSVPAFVTFGSNLFRIRIKSDVTSAKDVFEFLKSDSGQRVLRAMTVGEVIPRLSIRDLSQAIIFLPEMSKSHRPASTELTAVARTIREIKSAILPALERVEHQEREQPDAAVNNGQEVQEAASRLRAIAALLVPEPLADRVVAQYPMPIALAYRRFLEARFNVYEQVLRLRDIFEATSYFLYHTVLVDACRNLYTDAHLAKTYFVDDSGARRAYNGFSMAARLDFVAKILSASAANRGQDLFIPDLAEVAHVVDVAKQLQEELRNRMSHTQAGSEGQQARIVADYQPLVDQMLAQLDFIVQYPLARIAAYTVKTRRFQQRTFVYRGTAPTLVDMSLDASAIAPRADSDHLVLLGKDEHVLDMYPLYQLIANADTRDETHLCFLKQRKKGRLEGESVQGNMPIELNGTDEFDVLQRQL